MNDRTFLKLVCIGVIFLGCAFIVIGVIENYDNMYGFLLTTGICFTIVVIASICLRIIKKKEVKEHGRKRK